jgi:hypothetical protein
LEVQVLSRAPSSDGEENGRLRTSELKIGDDFAHRLAKFLHIEWLGDDLVHCERVIARQAESLSMTGDHDDQLLWSFGFDFGSDSVPFVPWHLVINNNKVEFASLHGG